MERKRIKKLIDTLKEEKEFQKLRKEDKLRLLYKEERIIDKVKKDIEKVKKLEERVKRINNLFTETDKTLKEIFKERRL